MSTRTKELSIQKTFLIKQQNYLVKLFDYVKENTNITLVPTSNKYKPLITFRKAVIAVLATNRLYRIIKISKESSTIDSIKTIDSTNNYLLNSIGHCNRNSSTDDLLMGFLKIGLTEIKKKNNYESLFPLSTGIVKIIINQLEKLSELNDAISHIEIYKKNEKELIKEIDNMKKSKVDLVEYENMKNLMINLEMELVIYLL